jgi:hypothetical protein
LAASALASAGAGAAAITQTCDAAERIRGGAQREREREREKERDPPDSPEGGWEGRKRNLDFEEGSRLERRLLGLEVVTVWEEIFAIIGFEHAASPLHGRGSVTQGYYYLLG